MQMLKFDNLFFFSYDMQYNIHVRARAVTLTNMDIEALVNVEWNDVICLSMKWIRMGA